jgi:tetratricopeptide (TPR) repeat protein
MRLDPRNPDYYLDQQGWAYTELGEWKEAIPVLKRCLARNPQNFWFHVRLAEDYMGLGDEDDARAEAAGVERAVALEPNSAFGNFALALVMNATGRPAEGLPAAEKAIHIDPSRSAPYRQMQGWSYSQLVRWKEAISILKRFSFSDDLWLHVWLAVDYIEVGDDVAARTETAKVLRLEPQFSVEKGSPHSLRRESTLLLTSARRA